MIVSLVYEKGTILASKRTSYDELGGADLDSRALAERVSRQHKLICAAIKAGRVAELKEMSAKARNGRGRPEDAETTAQPRSSKKARGAGTTSEGNQVEAADKNRPAEELPVEVIVGESSTPSAVRESVAVTSPQSFAGEPVPARITKPAIDFEEFPLFDAVTVVEETEVLPPEAVAVVSELSGTERPSNEKLSIDLLGDGKFSGGDRVNVSILVCRGTARKVVPNAQIMVKVLGSAFRPVIFHASTDSNGLAKIHLQLPHFQAGRAAMLIRAIADGQEAELRRIVSPG
jgi:hypothetical protein